MAWTSPKTWVVGDVLTASDMNTYVRDNANALYAVTSVTSWKDVATGSGTATSVSVTVPSGYYRYRLLIKVEATSLSGVQITQTINGSSSANYQSNRFEVQADAVISTEEVNQTSLHITDSITTSGDMVIDQMWWDDGSAALMNGICQISYTDVWYHSGSTAGTIISGSGGRITAIATNWTNSYAYRYVLQGSSG